MKQLLGVLATAAAVTFAADLKPLDQAGYKAMVASNKGKVLVVNFWATYCVPCRKEMPAFVALQARYAAKGLRLVTVSADEPEQEAQARAFLDKTKVSAPVYIKRAGDDDKFINSVDPKWSGALPLTILYDKTGRKVKSIFGEAGVKELEAAIVKLL